MPRQRILKITIFILVGVIFLALFLPQNLVNLDVLSGVIHQDKSRLSELQPGIRLRTAEDCRENLLLGAIENELVGKEAARPVWEVLLSCSTGYISIINAEYTSDPIMLQKIIQVYPQNSSSYYLLAILNIQKNPKVSKGLLTQALQYDPTNGGYWCLLGRAQQRLSDPPGAAMSYAKCCINGDVNDLGCFTAGSIYEKLGDLDNAAHYYLMSHKQSVLDRGQELEKHIAGGSN